MADKADKAKEQSDANEIAAQNKREAEKAKEEARKAETVLSYKMLVSDVEDLKVMCDTRGFQRFVKATKKKIEEAKVGLLTAKPADVISLQATARVAEDLLSQFRDPVDQLNKFINEMPLFTDEFNIMAQWSQELMRVDIRTR